jgi:hypothetical protein
VVLAVRRQDLDALVIRVRDVNEAFAVDRQPGGVLELTGALAVAAVGGQVFRVRAELLDPVVARVEDVEVAGAVDGDGRRHEESQVLVGRVDVAERADGFERHLGRLAPGPGPGVADELGAVRGLGLLAGGESGRQREREGNDDEGSGFHALFSLIH